MGIPFTSTRWQIPEAGRKTRPLPKIFPPMTVPERRRRELGDISIHWLQPIPKLKNNIFIKFLDRHPQINTL